MGFVSVNFDQNGCSGGMMSTAGVKLPYLDVFPRMKLLREESNVTFVRGIRLICKLASPVHSVW